MQCILNPRPVNPATQSTVQLVRPCVARRSPAAQLSVSPLALYKLPKVMAAHWFGVQEGLLGACPSTAFLGQVMLLLSGAYPSAVSQITPQLGSLHFIF